MFWNLVTLLLALWGLCSSALCFVEAFGAAFPAEAVACPGCGSTTYTHVGEQLCSECASHVIE